MNNKRYEDIYEDIIPNATFMMIPASQLTSDVAYQRQCSEAFINKMIRRFDKNLIKVVRVSDRDGQFVVWDGQHTVEMIKCVAERTAGPDAAREAPIMCLVYHGLSYQEEALLFARQQETERRLKGYDLFNAFVEAEDMESVIIKRIINSYGFEIDSHTADYKVSCMKHLEKIYRLYGEKILAREMYLISETWAGKKAYLKGAFLQALAKFLSLYDGLIEDQKFIDRFETVSIQEIILEGKQFSRSGVNYCRALVQIFNKKYGKKLPLEIL